MIKKTVLFLFLFIAITVYGQDYKRIVSLAPSLTQSLYFLNAQDKIVGCTSYCEVAKKDKKQIVASAVKINIEKLISVKPDLVIASGLSNVRDLETIRKFGIKVEVFQSPKSFSEICTQFSALGKIIGKENAAEKIVSECQSKVKEIETRRKAKPKTKMFFQIGANPLFAVIPNTFMADYIRILNSENIASGLTQGTVTREFVIARNPDYIFIATMGIVGENEKGTWLKFPNIKASKKKNIFIIDSEIACQPTPITFTQTVETMDKLIK